MTREETKVILAMIQAAYPYYYAKKNDTELKLAVDVWYVSVHEYSAGYILAGLKPLFKTSNYPPTISDVILERQPKIGQN